MAAPMNPETEIGMIKMQDNYSFLIIQRLYLEKSKVKKKYIIQILIWYYNNLKNDYQTNYFFLFHFRRQLVSTIRFYVI